MTSCNHLLTLFLAWADAATSQTSEIFEITLYYHLHFSVRHPVSLLHPVEVLTCICVSVSFGSQVAIKVRQRLKCFLLSFVVHFVP